MKTVLITGTSSGIGQATVKAFAQAGWQVAATMRSPEKDKTLSNIKNVKIYALDVDSPESIINTLSTVKKEFGRIDAVVNNAGFAVDGIFEAMSDEVIQKQFNTNVFGLMRVTREAIKIFREQNGGTIIQIASMGGRLAFPLYSIYHATKWAVDGFSESLSYELKDLNIKVRIIEPGPIKTEFYGSSRKFVRPDYTKAYDKFLEKILKVFETEVNKGDSAEKVAQTILQAANETGGRLRYVVGTPAPMLMFFRKLLPDSWFMGLLRANYKL